MSFQRRKKRCRKFDLLNDLFLKMMLLNFYWMKREIFYKVLGKENLHQMVKLYFKLGKTYFWRKFFDYINHHHTYLNLTFTNPFFIQNLSTLEIAPNLKKKEIKPNQVYNLKFLADNSFEWL
jgi:hypothetical protein